MALNRRPQVQSDLADVIKTSFFPPFFQVQSDLGPPDKGGQKGPPGRGLSFERFSKSQSFFITLAIFPKISGLKLFQIPLEGVKIPFYDFSLLSLLKLDLVKMAKLACDQLCQRTLRIRQQIASVHYAYGSTLLAHTVHTVAKSCKIVFFASVCCACGSTLLAHTAHMVTNCKILCALLAYAAHAVANCQCMQRMRQQFARVDGACGSKHKMASISPFCKKCKIFISSLKSTNNRDFMTKIKSRRSKSHTWAPLKVPKCEILMSWILLIF